MKVKLFEYTRRWEKEDFEKEINDFMATVEVLDVVPVFILTRSLKHYAEDMGIPKPNVYGAGKETIRHLQQLTPNHYKLKRARVKVEDYGKLDPLEFERTKLAKTNHAVVKD